VGPRFADGTARRRSRPTSRTRIVSSSARSFAGRPPGSLASPVYSRRGPHIGAAASALAGGPRPPRTFVGGASRRPSLKRTPGWGSRHQAVPGPSRTFAGAGERRRRTTPPMKGIGGRRRSTGGGGPGRRPALPEKSKSFFSKAGDSEGIEQAAPVCSREVDAPAASNRRAAADRQAEEGGDARGGKSVQRRGLLGPAREARVVRFFCLRKRRDEGIHVGDQRIRSVTRGGGPARRNQRLIVRRRREGRSRSSPAMRSRPMVGPACKLDGCLRRSTPRTALGKPIRDSDCPLNALPLRDEAL